MDIKKYTESIDIRSPGRVLAEMIKGKPFLQGDTTNLQLVKIGEMLGCPKEEDLIDIPNRKIIIEKIHFVIHVNSCCQQNIFLIHI